MASNHVVNAAPPTTKGEAMSRQIDYGNLMHRAMRGLIRNVLDDVAANGLPGAHHFFIKFDTSHPDAELADCGEQKHDAVLCRWGLMFLPQPAEALNRFHQIQKPYRQL